MKKINAFTLIELLVTVTIIGILSSIAVYGLTSVRQKAQDTSHLSSIRDLQLSLEAYKSVNNTYPDAGTQGSGNYILNLAPGFIGKLPVDPIQSASNGFQYNVSSDKKTYCIYVRGSIFKPESQPDLYSSSCAKTWVACKGANVSALTTCAGIVGS
jgi:prepilin-type N-terminal cleavage/methylation domain-containing protein